MVLTCLPPTNKIRILPQNYFREIVVQAGLDVQQVTSMVVTFVL